MSPSTAQSGERLAQPAPALARAPRFGEALTRVASWRSALDRMTLPAVLHAVAAREETGVLVARNERREKHFYFVDGELRAARSTEHSELLGTRLLRADRISEQDLTDALSTCKKTGRSLGEELVARGIVRASSLLRELIEQVEARFTELFGWHDGTLWFVPGVREPHLEGEGTRNPCFPRSSRTRSARPTQTTSLRCGSRAPASFRRRVVPRAASTRRSSACPWPRGERWNARSRPRRSKA